MTTGFFIVARIIAAWTLFLSAGDALACSLKPGGNQAEFNDAKYVFTALVTRAEFRGFVDPESNPSAPQPLGFVYAEYELIEALKGTPSKKGTVVTINLVYGACGGVPIIAGDKYLFYVSEVQSNDDIPDDMKHKVEPSDLFIFTASSVSFRESHAEEALARTRAFVEPLK